MIWLYVASLIFGAVFVVPLLFGGLDFDGDFDTDFDADADLDVDTDAGDIGGADSIGLVGDVVSSLVSFRSVMFFATFFGLTGTLMTLLEYNLVLTAVLATTMGLVGAVTNGLAFSLLHRAQSSSHETTQQFEGRQASVSVPIEAGQRGRIQIDLGGQPQFMIAEALDSADSFERGHPVVVVKMAAGVATVSSLGDLGLPGGDLPEIGP